MAVGEEVRLLDACGHHPDWLWVRNMTPQKGALPAHIPLLNDAGTALSIRARTSEEAERRPTETPKGWAHAIVVDYNLTVVLITSRMCKKCEEQAP